MNAPEFSVSAIDLYERNVRFRIPFRFGNVTLSAAPQAFVRTRICIGGNREVWGSAAEMLAPKWFDKTPSLSNEQTIEQLRRALFLARVNYLRGAPMTAFDHFASRYEEHLQTAASSGLNALVAGFGQALIDRALLDALCRQYEISFYDAVKQNLIALNPGLLLPEFAGFDMSAWLKTLQPAARIEARHTVGFLDTLDGHPQQLADGLPESLREVIETYGQRWFKLKVCGDADADFERLQEIAKVLDTSAVDYRVSLDGNEQYDEIEAIVALWQRLQNAPAFAQFCDAVQFVEQPISRTHALYTDVRALSRYKPVIIDESDDTLDSFPRARKLGYRGVSVKSCKGVYKAIINAARCSRWRVEDKSPYLLTGEDLSTQAGLAVQQDLALSNLLEITHIERNGHHYVNGMAGLPLVEQAAFLAAHPDLYHRQDKTVRVKIENGSINIRSLACSGFASRAEPDWTSCEAMRLAKV